MLVNSNYAHRDILSLRTFCSSLHDFCHNLFRARSKLIANHCKEYLLVKYDQFPRDCLITNLTSESMSEVMRNESSMESSMMPGASKMMARHPFIYVIGGIGTAVIDPVNWQFVVTAPGIEHGLTGFLVDNHYRDSQGRLWSGHYGKQPFMPWDVSSQGHASVWDPMTFANKKTIPLGQNVVNTAGLTPDGKFAVVPISTGNQLDVFDTETYQQVATVGVGSGPTDMMVSADGRCCCEPDVNSDTLTVVDPKMWKVMAKVPTGEGTGPFMVTTSPNSKFASVQCCGYHGGTYGGAVSPPAVSTGKGFAQKYVDLGSMSVIKNIPLDFLAVWDEFTPDGKYDFVFGPLAAKTLVVDARNFEVAKTIPLASPPSYITPDPSGKYVYASVKTGLEVIDASSLEIVGTIPTGGIVGTPLVMQEKQ
jgi:DNA-binding beta-propeller fold protein YncE